jgi:biotin carboxylase
MSAPCVAMVGFGRSLLSHLNRFLPPGSVIVVEDPDIIEKRGVHAERQSIPCLREVLPAQYHQSLDCVDAVVSYCAGTGTQVSAVLAGLEYGVAGAAALADRLGLPGAGPGAATALTDKLLMREAAAAAGILVPEWREVRGPQDVAEFAAGGPVVLKPANRHASLGVQLLPPGSDLATAWTVTTGARDDLMLPDRELAWRYVAERLVTGHEYSAEALVRDGHVVFLNVTDKLTAGGRYPVELGHVVPALLNPELRELFPSAMSRLVEALKFSTGILHAEWMAQDSSLTFIECAGRIPGDSIVDLIDMAYGFSLVRELLTMLAGQPPAIPDQAGKASAIRFVTAPPGTVTSVAGLGSASRADGVVKAAVSVRPGDRVAELRSSWDRVGQVIAVGDTPAAAAANAAAAAAAIRIATGAERTVHP